MKKNILLIAVLLSLAFGLANPYKTLAASIKCGVAGINTAVGCIPVLTSDNGTSLINFIIKWAIGVGSGIAFLLILYAGFMTMTSQGNPERLKAGHELLGSAISGIILLIFSIFLLNLIGVNILGIFQ
jgi:hypothetical protein